MTHFANAFFSTYHSLPFPDLAHLHISRPTPDLKRWQDQVVDLSPVLESGDCAKDVRLSWGDVVEIPEADHPLNATWPGFSKEELANLKKCLTRQVEIVVKGKATKVTLAPQISNVGDKDEATAIVAAGRARGYRGDNTEPFITAHTPFWLRPVLLQSKLVLISSDLSKVKVTRRDPATGRRTSGWWIARRAATPPRTSGSRTATGSKCQRRPEWPFESGVADGRHSKHIPGGLNVYVYARPA